jgi:cell wall-associated NlpC family hydrolase
MIGGVILGVIIIIVAPIAILLGVMDAGQQIDWSSPEMRQQIVANMSDEEKARLRAVEDTMNAIESAMRAAGYPGQARTAQVLYITALYDKAQGDSTFIDTLVGCFDGDPSDAELIRRVNAAFGADVSLDEFQKIMSVVKNTYLDASGFIDPSTKNNLDLVTWARMALDAHWGYVWSTYGKELTRDALASLLERYPDEVGGYEEFIRENWLNGRTSDCSGLIQSYSWYNPDTGEIEDRYGGIIDRGANTFYHDAAVKGPMDTMPETPGLAVWHDGHIGIYVGNGEVVEAMGTMSGVRMTKLPSSRWTAWLEIPGILYLEEPAEEETNP